MSHLDLGEVLKFSYRATGIVGPGQVNHVVGYTLIARNAFYTISASGETGGVRLSQAALEFFKSLKITSASEE